MPVQTANIAARINQIRQWIEAADREGVARSDLQLHLSHGDLSGLKRSRDVSIEELRFADGVTTFLGVEVADAAASTSSLKRRDAV